MAINLKKTEKIAKALGDVNRLKILNHIAGQGGTAYCSAIQECVNLAQPSISHHIKILLEADLIVSEKEGRSHKYMLNTKTFKHYISAIDEIMLVKSS